MKRREATLIVLSPRVSPARQVSAGGRTKEDGRAGEARPPARRPREDNRNQLEAEGYLLP